MALAEYQYGHSLQGFSHIMNNLLIYRHWSKGFIEEVLHGLEYKPSGVCPHQCWSETMVLQPAIEGMLGLECNALEKSLTLAPAFPFDWDSVSAEHIRIGNHRIDFVYIRSGNSHSYSITPSDPEPMNIAFGPLFPAGWKAISVSLDGTEIEYELTPSAQGIRCWLEFSLDGNHTVNIIGEKGISMLPLVAYPRPGDPGNGTRILSASLSGNRYSAVLEGPSGTTGHFDLWISGFQIISSFNIDSIEKNNELLKIGVKFDPSNDAYVRKEISLEFN